MTLRQFFWNLTFSGLDLPISRRLFGRIWCHMNEHLPVQYLRQTDKLLAFNHPRPAYPVHILLVPKRAISNIKELSEADSQLLIDVFACVKSLVDELGLEERGYRLVVNGGLYQDIPQLHFHLISEA
jgi:histidine triad (HIT) family protein